MCRNNMQKPCRLIYRCMSKNCANRKEKNLEPQITRIAQIALIRTEKTWDLR